MYHITILQAGKICPVRITWRDSSRITNRSCTIPVPLVVCAVYEGDHESLTTARQNEKFVDLTQVGQKYL